MMGPLPPPDPITTLVTATTMMMDPAAAATVVEVVGMGREDEVPAVDVAEAVGVILALRLFIDPSTTMVVDMREDTRRSPGLAVVHL